MNNPTITIDDLRNSGALVSTVPTIAQMKKENRRKEAERQKAELANLSEEELDREMKKKMPMCETIKVLLEYVSEQYPEGSFLILGVLPKQDITAITIEDVGDTDKLSAAICEGMQRNRKYLNIINTALRYFCHTSSPKEAEEAITGLQDIIQDLQKCMDPNMRIMVAQAEIKRLRKAGRLDLVKIKEKEVENIIAGIEARKIQEKKAAELRELRLANLAKGRATLAAKREKEKKAKQNHPQPNFAKMAKKKRQQIAARQAEKKKKKGASGDANVKSCSQLLKQ